MMDDLIINAVDEEEDEFPAIARLIELGRQKSYVTIDDILRFFPDVEQDVEQLEEAFAALLSAGIPYIEDLSAIEGPSEDDLSSEDKDEEEDGHTASIIDELINNVTDASLILYLKEINKAPLLNADEEVTLAQRIELGRLSRKELAKGNMLSKRRMELRLLIEDGWTAREHLITANSRLVISVAKKIYGQGCTIS